MLIQLVLWLYAENHHCEVMRELRKDQERLGLHLAVLIEVPVHTQVLVAEGCS